ncbi:hypothetical protein NicSoilB8_01650 [Arthrobacter sp. NicSoilB8]|nr:hypothetical protein NicSoilB8_01650 [Arthrobacter sp. NicSoilB8]
MPRDLKAASTVRASTVLTGSTGCTEALGMADLAGLADLLAAALDGEPAGGSAGEPEVQADAESRTTARTEGSTCFRRVIMPWRPNH